VLAAGVQEAAAQQMPQAAQQRVIRVVGTGEARVTPDLALLDLAVETAAPTARAAAEQNARTMDRVIRALATAGVARADIRTGAYTLFPQYAQPDRPPIPRPEAGAEEPRIVGYRVRNALNIRTRDLERVGALIDAALGAGANRFDGLRFTLQDDEAARDQALRAAAARARRTAETMAVALGVELGPIVEATTAADAVYPMVQFERAGRDLAAMAATPIEAGEQSVTATVSVTFAIR
jgi:uncharacterized protein